MKNVCRKGKRIWYRNVMKKATHLEFRTYNKSIKESDMSTFSG